MRITVFASYRVGSTSFCKMLANKHGLGNFDEAFHQNFDKPINLPEDDFVVKIMPNQDYKKWGYDPSLSYTYKLMRRHFNEQLASQYMTTVVHMWGHNNENFDGDMVIQPLRMQSIYVTLSELNYKLRETPCEETVYYEDIVDELPGHRYSKPSNYDDILELANITIKEMNNR